MALRRGEVVVLSIPFTNGTGAEIDLAAALTSQPPRNDNELALRDWEAAHLLKPSTVRPKLFTATRANVPRSPGRLSNRDMAEVERVLRWALEL